MPWKLQFQPWIPMVIMKIAKNFCGRGLGVSCCIFVLHSWRFKEKPPAPLWMRIKFCSVDDEHWYKKRIVHIVHERIIPALWIWVSVFGQIWFFNIHLLGLTVLSVLSIKDRTIYNILSILLIITYFKPSLWLVIFDSWECLHFVQSHSSILLLLFYDSFKHICPIRAWYVLKWVIR